MKNKVIGTILLITALIFGRLETKYFGNNWLPQTKEEVICDIVSLIMCITGIILMLNRKQ